MAIIIGAFIAVAVGLFATIVGLGRERAFYPVVTIVVAHYYALFAVLGASTGTLITESLIAMVFISLAAIGFRRSPWIVMAALAGHGIFDMGHGLLISNPGMPLYWPDFCATFDVILGGYMAWQIKAGKIHW